ncbi:pyridoxamine 5'-phosphate oxidase family protein, partial [Allofournierella sp.]
MEELKKLLESRPTLYLATVEGYLPRVRPINHYMIYNGYFYIAMGKHKEAYKQLLDNTNLELCADLGEQRLLRIQGTVNFDRSP